LLNVKTTYFMIHWYLSVCRCVPNGGSVLFTSSLHCKFELFLLREGSRHICIQSVCRYFCAVL